MHSIIHIKLSVHLIYELVSGQVVLVKLELIFTCVHLVHGFSLKPDSP